MLKTGKTRDTPSVFSETENGIFDSSIFSFGRISINSERAYVSDVQPWHIEKMPPMEEGRANHTSCKSRTEHLFCTNPQRKIQV